jgi:hypothetical protein
MTTFTTEKKVDKFVSESVEFPLLFGKRDAKVTEAKRAARGPSPSPLREQSRTPLPLKRGGIPGRVKNMTAEEVAAEIEQLEEMKRKLVSSGDAQARGRLQTRLNYMRAADKKREQKRQTCNRLAEVRHKTRKAVSKGWRVEKISQKGFNGYINGVNPELTGSTTRLDSLLLVK